MLRSVARKSAYTILGTTFIGASSVTAYANTEHGKGLKRQIQFWSNLAPIIANYYIYTSSSSPYVKLEKLFFYNDSDGDEQRYTQKRNDVLQSLHEKHSKDILHTLQSLKGLYIKLGQVLSVTALPIPQVYKKELRVLQSDVPGYEDYETVIKSIIEKELNQPVEDVFEVIETVPCGAASIGQAHRAKLKSDNKNQNTNENNKNKDFDVVIKVQYPHSSWQVPADIECIGQFTKFCIWFDLVDESSAEMSFKEFSRQFLSELDYETEMDNLKLVYESSLDHINAPYHKRKVTVPKVYESLCTDKVITMEYIPGPKIEDEARKQLQLLGIKTDRSIKDIVKDATKESEELLQNKTPTEDLNSMSINIGNTIHESRPNNTSQNWKRKVASTVGKTIGKVIGVDTIFWMMRQIRRILYITQASTVKLIQSSPEAILPSSIVQWAKDNEKMFTNNTRTLNLTKEWIDALFDVHGHQIFQLGCFNADCHPGNILVIQEDKVRGKGERENDTPILTDRLGLIDFGQCKRLTPKEQLSIAKFILSIANKDSDDDIANNFRQLGVKTKNDSTEFLAKFSKLMFGPFQPEHMEHKWHIELHDMDKLVYFPNELALVYRTALLLRGLALSLQINCSVSEQWKTHAQAVVARCWD